MTMIRLYEIPKNSKIYIFNPNSKEHTLFIFEHIDGMYSYCTNGKGCILHLLASTPLEEYKNGYRIKENNETSIS